MNAYDVSDVLAVACYFYSLLLTEHIKTARKYLVAKVEGDNIWFTMCSDVGVNSENGIYSC